MPSSQDKTVDWFFNLFGIIAALVGAYWAICLYTGTVIPAIIEPYIGYIAGGFGLIWALAEMVRGKTKGLLKDMDALFNIVALAITAIAAIICYNTYYVATIPDLMVYIYEIGLVLWVILEWARGP